jgi:hypothetical protein
MTKGALLLGRCAVLAAVELTALTKLAEFSGWTTKEPHSWIMAVGLWALLLIGIFGLGTEGTEGHYRLGGVLLFAFQILANVLISFQVGIDHIPVETVHSFFGFLSAADIQRYISLVSGATISLVSLIYWSALGNEFQQFQAERRAEKERKAARLAQMNASYVQGVPETGPSLNGHAQQELEQREVREAV